MYSLLNVIVIDYYRNIIYIKSFLYLTEKDYTGYILILLDNIVVNHTTKLNKIEFLSTVD